MPLKKGTEPYFFFFFSQPAASSPGPRGPSPPLRLPQPRPPSGPDGRARPRGGVDLEQGLPGKVLGGLPDIGLVPQQEEEALYNSHPKSLHAEILL